MAKSELNMSFCIAYDLPHISQVQERFQHVERTAVARAAAAGVDTAAAGREEKLVED